MHAFIREMKFDSIDVVKQAGFCGFQTVAELRATELRDVPRQLGVYLVLHDFPDRPRFLSQSRGGWFKRKNPTVPTSTLIENWVESTPVLYIGKAGGESSKSTLLKRLRLYLKFGAHQPVGHWGGRYIWQLMDAENLLICWKAIPRTDVPETAPRCVEKMLIQKFQSVHGKRPFANLSG